MAATQATGPGRSRALPTIIRAGLIAGTLDITAAVLVYADFGPRGIRLLQGIAVGLMGKAALQGGYATAFVGLFCHYFIATSWAAIYFIASRRIAFLLERPVIAGPIYALIVYCVMNYVVIPLSAIGARPSTFSGAALGAAILVFCIGLPIALTVSRSSPRSA
jgi:hypothetical protein